MQEVPVVPSWNFFDWASRFKFIILSESFVTVVSILLHILDRMWCSEEKKIAGR